jgi:hypothetical protein
VNSSYQLFGDMFGSSPTFGMGLYTSGQFMRETSLPLYISTPDYVVNDSLNLYNLADISSSEFPIINNSLNLSIGGISQSVNVYPSSVMSIFINGTKLPSPVDNKLPLYTVGADFSVANESGSLPLFMLNYPISDALSKFAVSVSWNSDNVGKDITAIDNIYSSIDSDDNIRGVDDLICYGKCDSSNKCSEAIVSSHGTQWYYPEICNDGGIFSVKNTYTNLTFPSGSFKQTLREEPEYIVTENNNIIISENNYSLTTENSDGQIIFDPMPYSGHFYGIRKYSGLAPYLPYVITINGQTGSTAPIDLPTEIVEIEYNKNEDDEVEPDYKGLRLYADQANSESGDEFAKSIASKNDLLAMGAPKKTVQYDSGVPPLFNMSEAGTVFLYRRNERPTTPDWPLDNYKSGWSLEEALTLPSGMLKDYPVRSEIDIGLPFGLKPIQTNWMVGQEGRQFGHSLDLAIDSGTVSLGEESKQILVVGAPSAKWTPRQFDGGTPSGVSIGLMIFTDEFTPTTQKYIRSQLVTLTYQDILDTIKDKDIIFNYFGEPRVKFDVKVIICQPIRDDGEATVPQYPDKPDFITLQTMSRNVGFGPDPVRVNSMLESMKSAFFEAFPRDENKIHNNIPPILGMYVDNSNSLGRRSLEPAIDKFIDFYKSYSFASGLRDFNNVISSGEVVEYVPDTYDAENWIEMSTGILNEILDTGRLIQNNQVRFITGTVGKFNNNLADFNVPPQSGGRVYIFEKESGAWNLIQEIKSPNVTYSHPDRFGHSVSISDNADIIAIGSPYINQAVTILENKSEEKTRLYNSVYNWTTNNYPEKYQNQILAYESSDNQSEASKALYLSLDKDDKFKCRLDNDIQEYQTIHTLQYELMQPIGSWKFLPEKFAPSSRLGYSVDVNEDGSVVVASSPTDSMNLFNDADVYYVGQGYSATYNGPNTNLPTTISPSWQSSVNAGSIHVLESRKYYPHNKAVEYGRFGNRHELISNNTPDSGHFHYLSGIFEDKNFTKTPFTQNQIPQDAGLAFIITPNFDALTTSDEVFNNIYNWLALGDRNLVLVGNDPTWESSGIYKSSNAILNRLLERLQSRMRIVPARNQYESLPNNPTFKNIVPSFVPQGSTNTFTQRLSMRGQGVADIKIYLPNYEEYMPCQEVTLCDPEGEPVQLQEKCQMPLQHYGDLRAYWYDYCCKPTPKGFVPVIYQRNWPFIFGSYKPDCSDDIVLDSLTRNQEPIPLLVAAEKVNKEIVYPAIPAQFINQPVFEDTIAVTTEYKFGSTQSEDVKFSWSVDSATDNYDSINLNFNNSTLGRGFYKPDYNGLLQASAFSEVDVKPYYTRVELDNQANYCVEYNYPYLQNRNRDSKVIVLAGITTESRESLLTGFGDQNVKFYANLVSKSRTKLGESTIAQLGGWTNRSKFTDGYDKSYLESLFKFNFNKVTENVDTSFISADRSHLTSDFDIAWISNVISQPSNSELNDLINWLNLGNRKLIITYDNFNLNSFIEAQKLCSKLDINLELIYSEQLGRYYNREAYDLTVNQSHQAAGSLMGNKIEDFNVRVSFYPMKLNGGTPVMYSDYPINDTSVASNVIKYWSFGAGIAQLKVPVEAGSGYKIFITTESDSIADTAPLKAVVENATVIPKLPYPDSFLPTELNDIDIDGNFYPAYQIQNGSSTIVLDSSQTSVIDVQAASGVDSINIYFTTNRSRALASDIMPKTTKIIGVSGVLIPVETSVLSSIVPVFTGEIRQVQISDPQPETREIVDLIRPITTDNTKYCTQTCRSKGLGGKDIEDGPVVAAQEIEIISPFNAGFARSRITVITDSSLLQGRHVTDQGGVIPADTVAFIRSLYPDTVFNSPNAGRQFNTYTKIISPQRGSPAKYFANASYSGINHYFGSSGTASLSTINQYESLYNPSQIKRPDLPWEGETNPDIIEQIKNTFISGFYTQQFNHASTARFSGVVDGTMYTDAGVGGGLPQILKDKKYDYLDIEKFPTGSGYFGDLFGYSVAVRGNKIIVGSPFSAFAANDNAPWSSGSSLQLAYDGGAGAVFMFEKTGSGIDYEGKVTPWQFVRKLKPESLMGQLSGINARSDQFGYSLDMHEDTIIIGSPSHDYGNAYDIIFDDGAFARKNFRSQFDIPIRSVSDLGNLSIRSELELDGINASNAGAIYLYENKISDWENKVQNWQLIEKSISNFSHPSGERFGNKICLSRPRRTDADYTIFAGSYNASGYSINTGASYIKDIMLRKPLPSYANSGAYIDAKVFGDRDLEGEPTVRLFFKNNDDNSKRYFASGIVVANERGEIFLEASGQDPAQRGFVYQRPYIKSIVGFYQYGKLLENSLTLYCDSINLPPSSNMNLFMDGENSAYVYNTVGLYSITSTGSVSNSGLYLTVTSPSGSSSGSLSLYCASGIGIDDDGFNLYVRGK